MNPEKTKQPKVLKIFHNRSRCSLEEVRGTPRREFHPQMNADKRRFRREINGYALKKSVRLKTRFQAIALFPKQALHAGLLPAAMPFVPNHFVHNYFDHRLSPSEPLGPSPASAFYYPQIWQVLKARFKTCLGAKRKDNFAKKNNERRE